MDRDYILNLQFTRNEQTKIVCPQCGVGRLACVPKSIFMKASAEIDYVDPESCDFVVSGILACSFEECRYPISFAGIASTEPAYDQSPSGWSYHDTLTPKFFFPSLPIFQIPKNTPSTIAEELNLSFSSFFNDTLSAGAHARNAVERFLDENGVSREISAKNGKNTKLKLHKRIELFKVSEESLAMRLMAIKWLGNEAAHGGVLSKKDILDVYEVLSFVIDDIYVHRSRAVRTGEISKAIECKFK